MTDPTAGDGAHEIIIRNKNGIKSHALLFTHENPPDENKKCPLFEEKPEYMTLASISSESEKNSREKSEDIDIDDLGGLLLYQKIGYFCVSETFVIPKSSMSSASDYVLETPGRGFLISPFKTLIDPTCILPPFCEEPCYTEISTVSESQAEQNEKNSSVMELFHD